MKKSTANPNPKNQPWLPEYTIAALLGIAYIILFGLFTWIFNYSM